jgi:hypothetical protein
MVVGEEESHAAATESLKNTRVEWRRVSSPDGEGRSRLFKTATDFAVHAESEDAAAEKPGATKPLGEFCFDFLLEDWP